ncbi:MAG TPA: hypothetical protein VKP58_11250 [Candidatus Acidoferrum sp.]|nr:hypothetical protein [Candidatus Acidoferrum sp.]
MAKRLKMAVVGFAMALLLAGSVCAQEKKAKDQASTAAPIPAQILAAKKVFIANGGGDESGYEEATYSGGPDRAYNEFYSVMKAWGRYELVASPGEADLVFEIRFIVFQPEHARGLKEDDPATDAQMRLVIREAKSREKLWGLTAHARAAVLQSNRDKNFEEALGEVVVEVKKIAGPAK